MHLSHLLGAGALFAGLGLFLLAPGATGGNTAGTPPTIPVAAGHYVLVVEGDRDQLTITHANRKAEPWGGVAKGFTSDWSLSIRALDGSELANVPLDMSRFDLSAGAKGNARRVEGCIVTDSRVAMLANVPCHAAAASYVFLREKTVVGTVDGATVERLAGGGR